MTEYEAMAEKSKIKWKSIALEPIQPAVSTGTIAQAHSNHNLV